MDSTAMVGRALGDSLWSGSRFTASVLPDPRVYRGFPERDLLFGGSVSERLVVRVGSRWVLPSGRRRVSFIICPKGVRFASMIEIGSVAVLRRAIWRRSNEPRVPPLRCVV